MTRLLKSQVGRQLLLALAGWTLLLGTFCCVLGTASAGEERPDHLSLLESLGRAAVVECLDQLDFPPGTDVHLIPETEHPANWFVGGLLARGLRERGYGVIRPALAGPGGVPAAVSVPSSVPGAASRGGESQPVGPGDEPPETGPQSPLGQEAESDQDPESDQEADDPFAEADESESGEEAEGSGSGTGEEAEDEDEADLEPIRPARRRALQQQQKQQEAGAQTGVETPGQPVLILPPAGEILTFRVLECGVSYPWVKRDWLVGPRRYGRYASVKVRGSRVVQPGGRVTAVAAGDRINIDELPGWALPYVEGNGYPFAIERPEGAQLRRLIEPVIVTAIIGGLVYLFDQNQK